MQLGWMGHWVRRYRWRLWATALVLAAVSPACSGCSDDESGGQGSFAEGAKPELVVSPTSLTFSAATVDRPETLALEIRNAGTGELRGFSYALNPSVGPFSFEDPQIVSLKEGESVNMRVTYSPIDERNDFGQLAITASGQTELVDLNTLVPTRELQCEPSPIVFSNSEIGVEQTQTVVVRNIGTLPLTVTGTTLEFGDAVTVAQPLAANVELRPDEASNLELSFVPDSGGNLEDRLFIETAEAEEPFVCLIRTSTSVPLIDLSPPRIDFGNVPTGATVEEDVLVINRGDAPLVLEAVAMLRGSSEDFTLVNAPEEPISIEVGDNATITIAYTAGAEVANGTAIFFSNDPIEPELSLPLLGRPSEPDIGVDPTSINFGNVGISVSSPRELAIFNNGAEALEIQSVELDGGSADFRLQPDPGFPPINGGGTTTIEPGALARISVVYAPTDVGPDAANIIIDSNDPDTPELLVPLTGNGLEGVECDLQVGPDPLNFGLTARGSTKVLPVTVRNTGTGPCQYNGATARGIFNNAFAVSAASLRSGEQLAPGQSMVVEVDYNPTTFDLNNGQMEINISDPSNGQSAVFCNAGERCANGMGNPFECDLSPPPSCGVQLTGLAGISDIAVIPGSVDFGLVTLGCASQAQLITVYNTGVVPLRVNNILFEGCSNEFELRGVPQLPFEVATGNPLPIQVVYRPTDLGEDQCVLRIDSDANAQEPTLRVPLRGEGTNISRQVDVFEQIDGRKVDVLFVIDGSGSMSEEQSNVSRNLGQFLGTAELLDNEFQIGVTHLDLGATVRFDGVNYEAGELMGTPSFLTRQDPNYLSQFQNRVDMGASGGTQEAGLEAARQALSDPLITETPDTCTSDAQCTSEVYPFCSPNGQCGGRNAGFLREDASLEIIILSDEEDQSTATPDFYVDFFQSIKGFRNDSLLNVSVIVGANTSSNTPADCTSGNGDAAAGRRYDTVAQSTGGTTGSICAADFGGYLQNIGNRAFGLRREFFLSRAAEPATVQVRVNGANQTTGWTYDETTNSIIFERTTVPMAGALIEVEY
ncbi:MAG: choice-of-anchor D domain-containing protein, partial [Myxococcota bacterium]